MRLLSLPTRDALDFGPRPDPAAGVFETLLVREGEAVEVDAHLTRLAASAQELYGVGLPGDLDVLIAEQARRYHGRLRITFTPDGEVQWVRAPIGPTGDYRSVAPFSLPGGLGPHKWADRRMVDMLAEAAGYGVVPLIVDSYGAVLEATWANVLIEEDGQLISPPHDGRFRSGVGCRRHTFREEPVDLDRLLAADAVLLTSALRTVRIGRR